MSAPTHARERRAPAAATQARSVVCPKCGGPLEFRSDAMGYGVTIEQCENPHCDHWCTLERAVRPELARVPLTVEVPRSQTTHYCSGRHKRPLTDRMMAALPIAEADAIRGSAVAARIGHPYKTVRVRLSQLFEGGYPGLHRANVAPIGKRPIWVWWRTP